MHSRLKGKNRKGAVERKMLKDCNGHHNGNGYNRSPAETIQRGPAVPPEEAYSKYLGWA